MKKPTCDLCGKVFSRRDNMERHRTRHLRREVYRCETCGRDFSQKSYMKLHRRLHTGERPFGCNLCGKAFSRNDHLVIHIRGHQGIKLFKCQVCLKSFARRSYLTVHQRIHTNTRPYKCHVCGCAFYRGDHLVRHQSKQHNEVRTLAAAAIIATSSQQIAGICNDPNNLDPNSFNTQCETIVHHHQHQQPSQEQQVQVVTVQTTSEMEEAEVQQAFKCTDITCNNNISNAASSNNNNNNIIHTPSGEQLVAAVINGNKTTYHPCSIIHQNHGLPTIQAVTSLQPGQENGQQQQQQQQQHHVHHQHFHHQQQQQQHHQLYQTTTASMNAPGDITGLAYRCEFCTKCFSRRDGLERHKSTHLNEKLYSCEVCHKCFSRRSYLSVHRRIHTGEKPFVCDRCGFAFSRKDHLLKHKRANQGERKLSCVPPKHPTQIVLKEDGTVADGIGVNCHQVAVVVPADALTEAGNLVVAHATAAADQGEVGKTMTMYQTTADQTHNADGTTTTEVYPVMSAFPTTIEISQTTAQIFPTIQMYPAAAQLNVPLHANVSHEIIIPTTQIAQSK